MFLLRKKMLGSQKSEMGMKEGNCWISTDPTLYPFRVQQRDCFCLKPLPFPPPAALAEDSMARCSGDGMVHMNHYYFYFCINPQTFTKSSQPRSKSCFSPPAVLFFWATNLPWVIQDALKRERLLLGITI